MADALCTAEMRALTALNIKALREEIAHYCTLGARVIDQAQRRVLDGEQRDTRHNRTSQRQTRAKMTREALAKSPARQYSYPDEIGITDRPRSKSTNFATETRLVPGIKAG